MRSFALSSSSGALAGLTVVYLAIVVFYLAAGWRIYAKAGQPGWAIIIPVYNIYVMLKIVGRPWWWLLLYLVPIVNLVIGIIVAVDLSRSFGKGVGFALGLIFLSFIFYPILGFGSARYVGPAAGGLRAAPVPPAPGTFSPPPPA